MDLENELEQVVRRCQDGDRDAFLRLFGCFQPRLKYYVRRLNGESNDTEDILQDVWARIIEKIHQLQEPNAFVVWMYRIARNAVFSRYRSQKQFEPLPEEELSVDDHSETIFGTEDAERIHEALGQIKPHHREVLTLSFIEQMPYQMIADVVGCSIGTVRSRIYYAKQSLRQEMERHNG